MVKESLDVRDSTSCYYTDLGNYNNLGQISCYYTELGNYNNLGQISYYYTELGN